MQRQMIVDLQREIYGSGRGARFENGYDGSIRRLGVDGGQLLLQLGQLQDGVPGLAAGSAAMTLRSGK